MGELVFSSTLTNPDFFKVSRVDRQVERVSSSEVKEEVVREVRSVEILWYGGRGREVFRCRTLGEGVANEATCAEVNQT